MSDQNQGGSERTHQNHAAEAKSDGGKHEETSSLLQFAPARLESGAGSKGMDAQGENANHVNRSLL